MMIKKNIVIFIFLAFSLLFFSFLASADNETVEGSKPSSLTEPPQAATAAEPNDAIEDNQDGNEVLSIGAGITPDSAFYFVEDKILTQFRDDSKNREKKIAEIEEMIKDGNLAAARKALERYEKYASELEKEVDPEKSEEARRSAAAIRNKIKEISSSIPEEAKKDFIEDINKKEDRISTAAELSSKIKDLCEALSKVDPIEYERVCKTNDNAPKWQKSLDKKLTEEQRKEAEKFFNIMSVCFKNPDSCKCEDISIAAFAEKCKVVAPLAAKCEKDDEKACKEMDEKTEGINDLLPEHLQEVMASVEERYGEAKHGLYMPPECKEAGVKNPKECEKIMIRTHAPEECIEASDKGEIKFDNARQFEKACQEIMFKANAPEECIEAGLKDPKECGKLMFKANAPEECIEAGLTGESRSDEKKCKEIMESKKGERSGPGQGQGFSLGKDCKSITDKDEKLKCFEEMFNSAQQHYGFQGGSSGQFGEKGGQQGGWPEQCQRAQALTKESCEKVMIEENKKRFEDTRRYEEDFARSCREKGGRWDCGFGGVTPGNPCRCFFDDQFRPPQGQFPTPQQPPKEFQCPPDMTKKCEGDNGCFCQPPEQPPQTGPTQPTQPTQPPPTTMPTTPTTETQTGSQTDTETRTEQQTQTGGTSGSTSAESTGSTSTSPTTGSVIGIDNEFLDYYFK
ncbi:MAG: hypothetical protein AABW75_03990 [Nanoarchaeota archaeon]